MAGSIALEIVTPDGPKLKESVDELTAPSVEGEFGVLPMHRPMLAALPASVRAKARAILQSATVPPSARGRVSSRRRKSFDVCVLGQLRPVKDPLRTALAARRLPASERVQ